MFAQIVFIKQQRTMNFRYINDSATSYVYWQCLLGSQQRLRKVKVNC